MTSSDLLPVTDAVNDAVPDSAKAGDPADQLFPDRANRLAARMRSAGRVVVGTTVLSTVARATVLTVLVAGVTTWAVYDRTVTVEVDGTSSQVRIFGSEVSDALAAAGIEPGSRDLVTPAIGESIADGGTVSVAYARPLKVSVDGVEQTYWTHERTVDDAIVALGLRVDGAKLSTSRSAGIARTGLDIDITTQKATTLVVAGASKPLASTSKTVAELLAEAGITVDSDDRVSPAPDTAITQGLIVTVNKVDVTQVVEDVPIPMPTRTEESADLYRGETKVVQTGADGVEQVTWTVTAVDGVEESRVEASRAVTTPAVEQVVAKGTAAKPAAAAAPSSGSSGSTDPAPSVGGDVDSLNWSALAACESGGNPSIVSSNGLYHGLYQFDAGTWRAMGGSGVASQAPADEQTYRAKLLYQQRGASPWPVCGKKLFT